MCAVEQERSEPVLNIYTMMDTARSYAWLARTALTRRAKRENAPRRSLLLLAWLFPPQISGGVYRPAALARYAVERGWQVTVVCGPAPSDVSSAGRYMLDYVGPAARIVRIQPGALHPSWNAFPRVDGGLLNALQTFDVVLGETRDSPPGVIVATGPPFHNFIAARYLGRATGIPYVLDYRDEWTECPFGFVRKGNFDRRYERACLRGAARVVFTTTSHLEHQLEVFNDLNRDRCRVIPNGWEPGDLESTGSRTELARARLRVAFVGTLSDHSFSATFFAAMARLIERNPGLRNELRLSFVGQKNRRAKELLAAFPYQETLELVDEVPKPEALQIMRAADALLVINETALNRYLPGKIYEYLATETPVLVYGDGGEVPALIRRFDAGCVVAAGDVDGLSVALRALRKLRGSSRGHGIREWLSSHTRERLSHQFVDMLEGVVGYRSQEMACSRARPR